MLPHYYTTRVFLILWEELALKLSQNVAVGSLQGRSAASHKGRKQIGRAGIRIQEQSLAQAEELPVIPLLCFSDIIILGPRGHFCPGAGRESSWKLSTASATPKLSQLQLAPASQELLGFCFSSCQLEGKAKKKKKRGLVLHLQILQRDLREVKFGPLVPAGRRAVGFICPPTNHKFKCEHWSREKGKQSPENRKFKEKLSSFWCLGWGPKRFYMI